MWSGMAIPASAATQSGVVAWMSAQVGKALDFDGAYGAQCVDLFNFYLRDVWGIASPIGAYPVATASQIFNYNAPAGWTKIAGANDFRVGDIVIWDKGNGSTTGHVALVYAVNGGTVQILQQNFNKQHYCTVNNIHWTNLIRGVFRPPLESEPTVPFENIALGSYFIRNAGGRYLCVNNSGTGNDIVVWDRNGNTYEFEMEIQAAGNGYRIKPGCTAGTTNVVNVDANSVAPGCNVNIFRDGNNGTQWWGFQKVDGGYAIRNIQNPSVCLTVDGNGVGVNVSTYSGAPSQIWTLEPKTVPVSCVTLSQTAASLQVGEQVTLTATVEPGDAANKNVTWSSSDPAVATVENGVVTAQGAGSAVITVTTEDGGKTAQCQVTVAAPQPIHIPVTGVTLAPSALSLEEGQSSSLTVAVEPSNATTRDVAWSSSDPSVATVQNGVVTAQGAGSAVVTATTVDGAFTAQCRVTVTAPAGEFKFRDVADSAWYAPFVYDLVGKGVLAGRSEGIFAPNGTITRGEFAKILAYASGDDLTPYKGTSNFLDARGHWSETNINWAYENKIVFGSSQTVFSPKNNITRQEMAVMLKRYADYKGVELPRVNSPAVFHDNGQIASWAKEAVSAVQQAGIVSGKGGGVFDPKGNATRAEASKMVSILLEITGEA